jgi:hypothetical protein
MNPRISRAVLFCAGVLTLGFGGCGVALSDHPLHTAADATIDERLLGVWEPIPDKKHADRPQPRLYVGKLKGTENVHELLYVEQDKENHLKIQRFRAYASRMKGVAYLSVTRDGQKEFAIVKYTLDDKAGVSISSLILEKVAKAIKSETIAGRVKANPDYPKGLLSKPYDEVHLTAPPKDLRAWLTKAPAALWDAPRLLFRKIEVELPREEK